MIKIRMKKQGSCVNLENSECLLLDMNDSYMFYFKQVVKELLV